jgi:hypothetical protein
VRKYRPFVALVTALLIVPSAAASDRLALNASRVALAVSADGKTSVVTYRSAWTGGWATHGNGRWWQRLGNHCSAYDGPQLVALVAACRAPDGSYWALQTWQPKLPHRGYPPYNAGQTDWELDASHWTTPLAELEVRADWAFNGQAHNLFGRLLYNGMPVHGFHTVKGTGAPQDRYGRSLYINTFDSAYGRGWKRETSIVSRNPTGVFCYSFWPTHDVSLPGSPRVPPETARSTGST